MAEEEQVVVGKFFTRVRRVQQLLGVMPDGRKIPGGPYTLPQVMFGLGAGVLAWMTQGLWGAGKITNLLVCLGITVAVGFLSGKIPRTRRTFTGLVSSLMGLITRPRTGNYQGKPLGKTLGVQRIKKHTRTQQKANRHHRTTATTKLVTTDPATMGVSGETSPVLQYQGPGQSAHTAGAGLEQLIQHLGN